MAATAVQIIVEWDERGGRPARSPLRRGNCELFV